MGIIKNLFGNRSKTNKEPGFNWNSLESIEDVEGIIDQSEHKTVIIFKHSSRCGISSSVLRRFEEQAKNFVGNRTIFYLLNVIQNRNISNEMSQKFSIYHESPQLIVVKKGKVVAHDSHYEILNMDLSGY